MPAFSKSLLAWDLWQKTKTPAAYVMSCTNYRHWQSASVLPKRLYFSYKRPTSTHGYCGCVLFVTSVTPPSLWPLATVFFWLHKETVKSSKIWFSAPEKKKTKAHSVKLKLFSYMLIPLKAFPFSLLLETMTFWPRVYPFWQWPLTLGKSSLGFKREEVN